MTLSNLWGNVMCELFLMCLAVVLTVLGIALTAMGLTALIADWLDKRW